MMTWKIFKKWFSIVILAISAAMMISCADREGVTKTGFLKDYSQLKPDQEDKNTIYYVREHVDWSVYTKIILDPIKIQLDRNKIATNEITAEDIQYLRNYLTTEIKKRLTGGYPLVKRPGSDVLRLRIAITDLASSDALLNLTTGLLVLAPVDMGGAAMEVEVLDSLQQSRLAAVATRKTGSPFNLTEGYTKWSHAKSAFEMWAVEIRKALDEVRGVNMKTRANRSGTKPHIANLLNQYSSTLKPKT